VWKAAYGLFGRTARHRFSPWFTTVKSAGVFQRRFWIFRDPFYFLLHARRVSSRLRAGIMNAKFFSYHLGENAQISRARSFVKDLLNVIRRWTISK